ncbi:hypothetical protein [Microvirga sp. VF16]|uniref:hypothetical protein n=1 Tax=Microvirga sp. VF16 TaxID=2807101 RepID=UPI00193E9B84|nr:hypothetical protein [Microvirga sp. VF16]QRM31418.1 hypothetical protein JO965_10755 [Microvirga sp. VF16]
MPETTSSSILIVVDPAMVPDPDPFEDFLAVYYALVAAGARLLIASEAGGYPWLSRPAPGQGSGSELIARFLSDRQARDEVADTLPLRDVFVEDFEACVVIGGVGPVWEPNGSDTHALVGAFLKSGKPVAAICSRSGVAPGGRAGGLTLLSNGGASLPSAIRALLAALRAGNEPEDS